MIHTLENTVEVGKPVNVFLDGMKVKNAIYADTDAGIVEHYGETPQIDVDGESMKVFKSHGVVRVEGINGK